MTEHFEFTLFDLLSIGCRIGQEVYFQIRVNWVFVYDKETGNFIGKIRLRKTCLDAHAA